MKVKVNNTWYDSDDVPICVQLSEGEQQDIANLDRTVAPQGKYALIPDTSGMTEKEMRKWINT